MSSIADRLARVSALRPRRGAVSESRPSAGTSPEAERLLQLLDGECRCNRLGSHVIVRRRFPELRARQLSPQALRLIFHQAESICDPGQWLFLDTETTGLAGGTGTYAFLVGLGWWEDDGFVVEQYFMRDHSEEPSLLLELSERLSQRRVLVTFNGKSFDWPLLRTRYQMTRAATIQEPSAHLDLLHPARQLWRLHLQSVALTELEKHILGLDRGHDIPSETIPQRYFDFLRGGPAESLAEVFSHNHMDLCGLALLAMHIAQMLADPEKAACSAGELFGISRMLQNRGDQRLAGRIYQKALESGLPKAAEQVAQRELALLAKRRRDFDVSNALWEKLLDGSTDGLRAYEQLAIHYEHHARQPERAVALSREALVRLQEAFHDGRLPPHKHMQWHANFQHRLARLTAKLELKNATDSTDFMV